MSAESSPWQLGPYLWILGLAGVIAFVFLGRGCAPGEGSSEPIIRTTAEAEAAAQQAREAATPGMIKADRGEALDPDELEGLARAARIYESVAKADPTAYPVFFNMGQVYSILGDHERTVQRLEQYLELVPAEELKKEGRTRVTVADARFLISRSHFAMRRYEEAVRRADEALAMYPKVANYLHARASALVQLDRLEEARAALKRALKEDPTHEQSRDLLKLIGPG